MTGKDQLPFFCDPKNETGTSLRLSLALPWGEGLPFNFKAMMAIVRNFEGNP